MCYLDIFRERKNFPFAKRMKNDRAEKKTKGNGRGKE